MKVKLSRGDRAFQVGVYLLAGVMILTILYPLWFILIASFSDPRDVANGAVLFWPKEWTLRGYTLLFHQRTIWHSYLNTILYTVFGTLFALIINIPAGYVLSRKDLYGKKLLGILYVIPMFVSGGLIPTYMVIHHVGLMNNPLVMIVPFSVSCYDIIVARTFFKQSIPDSLWEAAQIDGASTFRFFIRIVLPLSKAIVAVIGLWKAVGIWNSWFNALIYLQDEAYQPIQLLLRQILITNQQASAATVGALGEELKQLAEMMKYSAIVVSTLPIMLVYPFLQKYFNKGVLIGSVKG
nr:carbohydrate ABC transporter permease [Lacticaseibacillus mingshuiensis]